MVDIFEDTLGGPKSSIRSLDHPALLFRRGHSGDLLLVFMGKLFDGLFETVLLGKGKLLGLLFGLAGREVFEFDVPNLTL
jgi:hypothetical protein